jgi:hypothetical protein
MLSRQPVFPEARPSEPIPTDPLGLNIENWGGIA